MASYTERILFFIIIISGFLQGELKTIFIDPKEGLDTPDCLNGGEPNSPCRSIHFAYYRRNVSRLDELYDHQEQRAEEASSNVEYIIKSGTVQRTQPLLIINSTNVTFRAENARGTVVRCVQFPNFGNISGFGPRKKYVADDIAVLYSYNIRFEGLVFERCGPNNSAIFNYRSEDIEIVNCVFRETTGSTVQFRYCDNVVIRTSVFENNNCQRDRSLDYENDTVDIDRFFRHVLLGGAITFYSQGVEGLNLRISECKFFNNSASPDTGDLKPVILRENGHGGAVLIYLAGVNSSEVVVQDSVFEGNHGDVDGGGLYVSTIGGVGHSNRFALQRLTFLNNSASEAGGGAISFNSFQISFNNSIEILNSTFESNNASAGGAVSFVLYQSDGLEPPDNLVFKNCTFVGNKAENDGTAVGLFALLQVNEIGNPVLVEDCVFEDNLSLDQNEDTSALAAFRFPITLNGSNIFRNNSGGGITLLNTQMDAYGEIIMDSNTAAFGGGLAMDDRCLLNLHPGTALNFTNNHAREFGGGIYLQLPSLRFVVQYFNRLCFIQFIAGGLQDVPPAEWDASISFINNSAGTSGAAIYASDFHGCFWLNTSQLSLIFEPNATGTTFYYENNTVLSSAVNTLTNQELGSASFNLLVNVKKTLVQPAEVVFVFMNVSDQLGNTKEALVSISRPGEPTIILALTGDNDRYVYTVPSLDTLRNAVSAEISGEFDITLNMSLLQSVGETFSLILTVDSSCHLGYELNNNGSCVVDTFVDDILRASLNNRYIFIREGLYAWPGGDGVILNNVPPSYVTCNRGFGTLGCFVRFDELDDQCTSPRAGIMCGDCPGPDIGVSLSLTTCNENCTLGKVLFFVMCVVVVIASFLIMFFNIQVPNELKGFLFYAQVVGMTFQQFSSSSRGTEISATPGIGLVEFLVGILGASLPIPYCFDANMDAHWVTVLAFVPSLLALGTILVYAIAARRLSCLGNRTSLGGIALLLLFIYKYVADTSFVLISCVATNDGEYRFFYNGNKLCSDADFLPFHIISWLLLIAVFVAPFFLAILPYKFYGKFKQFSDVLTNGLRNKYRWWGGWDLGRRLVFVIVSFLGLIALPDLVVFLQSMTVLGIFIIHCLLKPYTERYINMIEAIILYDFLMVMTIFISRGNRSQAPVSLLLILISLPFLYCAIYIAWKLFQYTHSKITKKDPITVKDLYERTVVKCYRRYRKPSKREVDDDEMDYSRYSDHLAVENPLANRRISSDISSDNEAVDEFRVPTYDN